VSIQPCAWQTSGSRLSVQPPMESVLPTMAVAPAPDTVPIRPVEAVPPLLPDAPGQFRDQEGIDELLHRAQAALAGNRLALPVDTSAYYYYKKVLELDPDNSQARDGVTHIADQYLALAKKAIEKGQHTKAVCAIGPKCPERSSRLGVA
jgi:hypothetical protein